MDDVVTQLRGISCDRAVGIGPNKVLSMPDAVGQILQTHMMEKDGIQEDLGLGGAAAPQTQVSPAQTVQGPPATSSPVQPNAQTETNGEYYDPGEHFIGTCPECSSDLQFAEGCVKCLSCGYSECG
jgi:ribonucleoside-diphosphate reductase alpha chain